MNYSLLQYSTPTNTIATSITPHYTYNCNYNYHCVALQYTPLNNTNYTARTTITTTLVYTTLNYGSVHRTTLHNTTRHHTALQYMSYTTPHRQHNGNCICNYTDYITFQVQLYYATLHHFTITTTHATATVTTSAIKTIRALCRTTSSSSCGKVTTAKPLRPFQRTQLQSPVGPSLDSPRHP